jgi:hypothetical protein
MKKKGTAAAAERPTQRRSTKRRALVGPVAGWVSLFATTTVSVSIGSDLLSSAKMLT